MGGWDADWNRDVLERIVALLFSLAGLADLAAGLPAPRRRHVLGILSVGEAEARAFLIGFPSGATDAADAPDMTDDASRLAARLRMLALLLSALLTQAARPGVDGSQVGPASHSVSGPAVGCAPPPPALDTS